MIGLTSDFSSGIKRSTRIGRFSSHEFSGKCRSYVVVRLSLIGIIKISYNSEVDLDWRYNSRYQN